MTTAEHVNFYENVAEVKIRLVNTVVTYDGKPYYVLLASDHMKDGIIRLYLDDLSDERSPAHVRMHVPFSDYSENGPAMDQWLGSSIGKNETVIRKMMNSPKFNKYRPFPLGMCNFKGKVIYTERTPKRHTYQGLTPDSLVFNQVSLAGTRIQTIKSLHSEEVPGYLSRELADCVLGSYPTPEKTLDMLLSPRTQNEGAAFHREFAFIKGPMDTIYLAYRSDVIGILPYADTTLVRLGPGFRHCRETVQSLRLFQTVE